MSLFFSFDLSMPADLLQRLRGATAAMLRDIVAELNELFAIPAVADTGAQYALTTRSAGDYARSYQTLRIRLGAAFRAANPSAAPERVEREASRMIAELGGARQRLSEFLNSGSTVSITVNMPETDARGSHQLLIAWHTTAWRNVFCNPFTYYVEARGQTNQFVRAMREGSPGALRATGPLIHMLHETSHVRGCYFGVQQRSLCQNTASVHVGEDATTRDIDMMVRSNPAIAQTGRYQSPQLGGVSVLGNTERDLEYANYYYDPRNLNETPPPNLGAEWVRWPT